MTSNNSNDENVKKLNCQEMDMYNNLEVMLKARNKIICRKEIALPCAIADDIDSLDIWDDNVSQVQPHKHLEDNEKLVNSFMGNINKLKQMSGIIKMISIYYIILYTYLLIYLYLLLF